MTYEIDRICNRITEIEYILACKDQSESHTVELSYELENLEVELTQLKTEIIHTHNFNPHNSVKDWMFLCNGHDDSRLTGGAFYYIGDKAVAQDMAYKRIAEALRASAKYYSQPWV